MSEMGLSRFVGPSLAGLKPYTPGEQPKGIVDLVKLNTNENPYPPSPAALAALRDFDPARLALYPDPECAVFKDALAEAFELDRTCFSPGNGSDELLAFAFRGLCGKGAAFPDITYSFYPVLAQLMDVNTRIVPLRGDFTWAPEDYSGLEETVFIANPNAPTGIPAPLEAIRALLDQDRDRLVVVDEAYVDFGGETALPLLDDYDNLLIIRTLSKSRSLAGLRAAFAVGRPELIAALEAIRFSFNPYNLDAMALLVAAEAVRDAAHFEETRAKVMATREVTAAALRAMGCEVLPSAANFLFVKPCGLPAADFAAGLRAHGIIVRYFDAPRVRDFVRVSIGTDDAMARFLEVAEGLVAGER